MNDDKEPVEQTEGGEGGENGQITQETLDNANVEVGHCKHWAWTKVLLIHSNFAMVFTLPF